MDSLNGYIMQYQLGDAEGLAIEIPDAQMTDFIHHFSQEVDDAKVLYGHNGWVITSVVTLLRTASQASAWTRTPFRSFGS